MISEETLFRFAYNPAVMDATLRRAYLPGSRWIRGVGEMTDQQRQAQREAALVVKAYIDNVLSGKYEDASLQDLHDRDFLDTAIRACDIINSVPGNDFKFGNIQKIINVTAKRYYLLCYRDPSLAANFVCCHCPVDSAMLLRVYQSGIVHGYNMREFLSSWSQENFGLDADGKRCIPNRYLHFQQCVRELAAGQNLLNALEYDYLHWMGD